MDDIFRFNTRDGTELKIDREIRRFVGFDSVMSYLGYYKEENKVMIFSRKLVNNNWYTCDYTRGSVLRIFYKK